MHKVQLIYGELVRTVNEKDLVGVSTREVKNKEGNLTTQYLATVKDGNYLTSYLIDKGCYTVLK